MRTSLGFCRQSWSLHKSRLLLGSRLASTRFRLGPCTSTFQLRLRNRFYMTRRNLFGKIRWRTTLKRLLHCWKRQERKRSGRPCLCHIVPFHRHRHLQSDHRHPAPLRGGAPTLIEGGIPWRESAEWILKIWRSRRFVPAASHGDSRKVSARIVLACRKLATLKGRAERGKRKEGGEGGKGEWKRSFTKRVRGECVRWSAVECTVRRFRYDLTAASVR